MEVNKPISVWRWMWPTTLAIAVFFASGQSSVAAPDIVSIDKVSHFAVFGLLATLCARALPPRFWWWGAVIASIYGGLDEWRQSFTPGRFVEVADWVADTAGAITAVAFYTGWSAYRRVLEWKLTSQAQPPIAKQELAVPDSG